MRSTLPGSIGDYTSLKLFLEQATDPANRTGLPATGRPDSGPALNGPASAGSDLSAVGDAATLDGVAGLVGSAAAPLSEEIVRAIDPLPRPVQLGFLVLWIQETFPQIAQEASLLRPRQVGALLSVDPSRLAETIDLAIRQIEASHPPAWADQIRSIGSLDSSGVGATLTVAVRVILATMLVRTQRSLPAESHESEWLNAFARIELLCVGQPTDRESSLPEDAEAARIARLRSWWQRCQAALPLQEPGSIDLDLALESGSESTHEASVRLSIDSQNF